MSTRHGSIKASNSALYREIEMLTLWLIGVGTRVPRGERMLQVMAEQLMQTLMDAQAACASALLQSEPSAKLEYISALRLDMTLVQSTVKTWLEWSSQGGQSVRILTPKQHVSFLRMMTSIGSQIHGWEVSLERRLGNKDPE